jgi:hypothetical protein
MATPPTPPKEDTIEGVVKASGLEDVVKDAENPPDDSVIVKRWMRRIKDAQKLKTKWADAYRVNQCRDYVLGFQRALDDERDAQGQRRYQLNRIGAAFKARIPSLFYYEPFIRVEAADAREDSLNETVDERAQLLQDTINTIVKMPHTQLRPECLNAMKEAFWAFGVIEVGYSAEWDENPLAGKKPPLVKDQAEKDEKRAPEEIKTAVEATMGPGPIPPTAEADPVAQLAEVPVGETFYARYIPAKQFLVSSNDRSNTEALDWIGYWEWQYVEDIKKAPAFKEKAEDLKPVGKLGTQDDKELLPFERDEKDKPDDMVPVWKLYDLRTKTRYVMAEGHDLILNQRPFNYVDLFPLRFDVIPGEWYPKPPITDQLDEQDEYNDSREYLRLFRKAMVPRYLFDKTALTPAELQKLENDEVGTFVGVENGNMTAIAPIPQPSMSGEALRTISLANNAFSEVSAVSEQQRQQSTADSATEARIVQQKGDVRNSYEQEQVAEWLGAIARGLMRCAIEKATLPIIVKMNADPYAPDAALEGQAIAAQWQQITAEQLKEADATLKWDVAVDVQSLSPLTQQQEAERWMQFLNLISNPGVGGLLALSPELLKHTMNLAGIRNNKEQQAITQALAMKMQLLTQPQPGVAPMPGGPPGPGAPVGPLGPPPPGPPS